MNERFHIRWMIRRDMTAVLAIEDCCFPDSAWNENDFCTVLRQRNCIGLVAEDCATGTIAGYMLYDLHPASLDVLNFAVAHDCRRQGCGLAMVQRLRSKLHPEKRQRITLNVRETNLTALRFFRAMGFRCIGVAQDVCDDVDEDAYLLCYTHPDAIPANRHALKNRISHVLT